MSAASVLAVCEYCTSTILRKGEALENIGKMAALQDDPTLLQIGSEGVYKGVHFGVIGRIQLRYADGLWNEWHVMFDDMRTGWLGEAAGEFTLSFEKSLPLAPPPFSAIGIDDRIDLGGRAFQVSNMESATCIAGQGELPFSVGPGYEAPVVDLRLDGEFATIDYSDDPPRVYVGEPVAGTDLKLSGLREAEANDALAPRVKDVSAFNCPQCAAPFKLSSGRIHTFGCASCGAVLDTNNRTVKLVKKAQEALDTPLAIPLNGKGRLDGVEWEVIGHMRRGARVDGKPVGTGWSEYLLFNPKQGFRWLAESAGHWNVVRNADQPLKMVGTSATLKGREFEHFEHYDSEVLHVLGEFYWQVKVGDAVEIDDYIAPPQIASRERTKKESTWSIGTYTAPEVLQKAFGITTPWAAPQGIAPNQPSPHEGLAPSLWKRFALFTLIGLVIQLFFVIRGERVYTDTFSIAPGSDKPVTTRPFVVKGNDTNLVVRAQTDLDNSWAAISYTLADPDTGKSWQVERQLEHYKGVDEDGDSWSEGSASDDAVFYDIPPGKYLLNIEAALDPATRKTLVGRLSVERGHASWLNWLLLQAALLLVPVAGWWRARAFEARRWADSDHDDD